MSRRSAAVCRALFTAARAPPAVPAPVPIPVPEVVASTGGDEEPMDIEPPMLTPSAPTPVAASIPPVDALAPCCTCACTECVYGFCIDSPAPTSCPRDGMDIKEQFHGC